MHWSNISLIYQREVRDQLRDRRTLFTIAVLPLLLYPLLGMSFLQIAQFNREHVSRIRVIGTNALPDEPRLMAEAKEGGEPRFAESVCDKSESKLLKLAVEPELLPDAPDELKSAAQRDIQSGLYDAVVYFPPNFATELARFRESLASHQRTSTSDPANVETHVPRPEVFVSMANDKSRIASQRVDRVLRRWRDGVVQQNLKQSNVPVIATEPFEVLDTDVSEEVTRRAAIWSKILPFIVLIWALTGAFYLAIDLCAGEKERGTLETLLCSPAQRSEIVWGKLFTVMTFSMATSLLNLLSMGLTGSFIMQQLERTAAGPLQFGPPPLSSMCWLVLALVPISALFSALSLAVAAFARSSKEGQYYLMPLLMITLPLMMLPLLPAAQLDWGTALIPVTGVMLLLRSLIEGQYAEAFTFLPLVCGVTVGCCLLAIRWAIDQFNNESVLFRETERWSLGLWLRHLARDRGTTPSFGEAILCGVLLLLMRFFVSLKMGGAMPESWSEFARTQMVSMIAMIGTPPLLMAIMLTKSPRDTLLLRLPKPLTIPAALLLAVVMHPVVAAIASVVMKLYPINPELKSQLESFNTLVGQANVWSLLGVIALAPAICEELAFRGFILSGLRHAGHKWVAIFISALFFGATHPILQQSLTAFVLGLIIGYIAVQTGSLLPGVLFHLVNNSLSLLVPSLAEQYPELRWLVTIADGGIAYHPAVTVAAFVAVAAMLYWFRSLPFQASAEEQLEEVRDHAPASSPAK